MDHRNERQQQGVEPSGADILRAAEVDHLNAEARVHRGGGPAVGPAIVHHRHVAAVRAHHRNHLDNVDSDDESNWDAPEEEEDPGRVCLKTNCWNVKDAVRAVQALTIVETTAAAGAFWVSLHVADYREPPPPPREVIVVPPLPGVAPVVDNDDHPLELADRSEWFRRFVTLLAAPGGGQVLIELELKGFDFDEAEPYRTDDVARLFGEVFRSHSALRRVRLHRCKLPATYLELLASSFSLSPSSPAAMSRLRELELSACGFDSEGVSHLAAMLGAEDCRLRGLVVCPVGGDGLIPDDCRRICDAVCLNRHLRRLTLHVKQVRRDTLNHVAKSPQSPLRMLNLLAGFAVEGFDSLARQLRTNTRMYEVHVRDTGGSLTNYSYFCRQMEETLHSYNYTLRRVYVDSGNIGSRLYTPKNRRIRTAVRRWERAGFRVAPTSLWPLAFATANAFPTLLYRLLRNGNVDALCDVVRTASTARKGRDA